MRAVRHILQSCFLIAAVTMVSACDPSTGLDLSGEQEVSMKDTSYRAADALIAQTSKTLPPETPILVGTLSDVSQMETSTPLGRVISEQVGARFVQRGFKVSDVRFRNAINVKESAASDKEAGEYFLSRDTTVLRGEQDVGAVITGTYVYAKREVLVNLRMIDAASSRVLAAYDYRVPVNNDVKALVKKNESEFEPNASYAFDWGW